MTKWLPLNVFFSVDFFFFSFLPFLFTYFISLTNNFLVISHHYLSQSSFYFSSSLSFSLIHSFLPSKWIFLIQDGFYSLRLAPNLFVSLFLFAASLFLINPPTPILSFLAASPTFNFLYIYKSFNFLQINLLQIKLS